MKEYSLDFKFYITTKLSRPHYPPEICVKVCMLNFMVTEEGLLDQMLTMVVKSEDEKRYLQEKKCITQEAENNRIIKELQDQILKLISSVEGDILEDDDLISTLKQSKAQEVTIQQA